jgi:hypothetical protein
VFYLRVLRMVIASSGTDLTARSAAFMDRQGREDAIPILGGTNPGGVGCMHSFVNAIRLSCLALARTGDGNVGDLRPPLCIHLWMTVRLPPMVMPESSLIRNCSMTWVLDRDYHCRSAWYAVSVSRFSLVRPSDQMGILVPRLFLPSRRGLLYEG